MVLTEKSHLLLLRNSLVLNIVRSYPKNPYLTYRVIPKAPKMDFGITSRQKKLKGFIPS